MKDFQKSKVSKFGKSFPKGEIYRSNELAIQDLGFMHHRMVCLLSISDEQIKVVPNLLTPHPNRTKKSIYSPSRHCIVCSVGSLHQRKLIHEMCHSLNKQIRNGKRRNIGASHGINYMTIYIIALGLFMFDGDFDYVEKIAQDFQCKYDVQKLDFLKKEALQFIVR